MTRALALCFALCVLPLGAAPLSKADQKRLKQEIGEAAGGGRWDQVGDLLVQLAEADDTKTWKFLVKVAEKAPADSGVAARLADCAEKLTDERTKKEVAKTAQKSKSEDVRRALASYFAGARDWESLIGLLEDDATSVVALAAWRLADAQVEEAVTPMIDAMDKLQATSETWDVFKNALGRMLKRRLGSAGEFRSWWITVQGKGGLSAIEAEEEHEAGATSVRLFGREIECTSVVFVLDISGSMESIDANQKDPLDGSEGTKARGVGGSQGRPQESMGRTRLERAKIALTKVLEKLPAHFKINLITYSTGIRVWKRGEDGAHLHPLDDANRAEAIAWIEDQKSNGVTATDDALKAALNVQGTRCVYLLSDGFVTHDGTTQVPTDQVLEAVREGMGDRHVTIHTMGFEGADRALMQALAGETGGKYSDIK